MPSSGFSRYSNSDRDLQPVAIVSVDPISRTAIGVTRTRHTLHINCAYATGDTITVPAAGEQWYCERFDMEWRLYGRIPFNDPTLNITPEEGQVSVGSAKGPLELNGTEIRANNFLRLGGVYYRDSGSALERSLDKENWEPIVTDSSGLTGVVQLIAKALTGFDGTDQALAILSLENWAEILGTIIENFSTFWNELCQNVFVEGLKRMGFGESDLAKIVDGFQNFVDYLFSVIFCDFDGNLTPQTVLARLRDLLAPIIDNPFVQGLQSLAETLGAGVGNLFNDAVEGATLFLQIVFDVIFCRWTDLRDLLARNAPANATEQEKATIAASFIVQIRNLVEQGVFSPAAIFKSVFDVFQFLSSPTINGVPNPVGIFVTALADIFKTISETTGNFLEDAVRGAVELFGIVFGILTCDDDALTNAGKIINAIVPESESVLETIVKTLTDIVKFLSQQQISPGIPNPIAIFLNGLKSLAQSRGHTVTNLFDGAIAGAVELVQIVVGSLLCDPNSLAALAGLAAGALPGLGGPLNIIASIAALISDITLNPLVVTVQNFVTSFFPDLAGGTLIQQLLGGVTNLVNWLLKIVTSIIPFPDLWQTLLPFPDLWAAVDAVTLPDITTLLGLENGVNDLWKILFKPFDDMIGLLIGSEGVTGLFSTFAKNLINFLSPMATFFTSGFSLENAATDFLQNVLGLLEIDSNGVPKIIASFVPAVNELIDTVVSNLLSIFGVDFGEGFNATTALITVIGNIANGLFGVNTVAVQRFFTNITGLFGGTTAFTGSSVNLSSVATYFINNVLSQGQTVLQSLVEGATSLVYLVGNAIVTGLRGLPFGMGNGIANVIQGLLDGLANLSRGSVLSGSNLLVDPGGEIPAFWTAQTNVTRDTSVKRSGTASLRITGGPDNVFWWTVDDLGAVKPIKTKGGDFFYIECWYRPTVATGTVQIMVSYTDSNGVLAAAASAASATPTTTTAFSKLSGTFKVPSGYDQITIGFQATSSSTTHLYRVDDMLARETTATQDFKDVIYQTLSGTSDTGYTDTDVGNAIGGLGDFADGTTQSGINLLSDPKINYTRLWKQSGLAVSTAFSKSTSQSLEFTGNGSARSFNWTVNSRGAVTPIATQADKVYYCECYVYLPASNPTATATVTMFARGTTLPAATGTDATAMTFTVAGTWYTVTLTNPTRGSWNRLFGYFTVPSGRDGFTAGITFTAASTHKVYVDDLVVYDVTESVNTNNRLYGQPTPVTKLIEGAIPDVTLAMSSGASAANAAAATAQNTANGASGTANNAQVVANGASGAINSTNNLLFGGPAGSNGGKILTAALPSIVGAVGSGVLLRRTSSAGSFTTNSSNGGTALVTGFYNFTEATTSSLTVSTSGVLTVTPSFAGWYQVEIGFGMVQTLKYYQWYFTPVLLKNGAIYKFGSGVVNVAYPLGGGQASAVPLVSQASLTVYLSAGETVTPGYYWTPDSTDTRAYVNNVLRSSDTIIVADVNGWFNYFSMSLLNRSLA